MIKKKDILILLAFVFLHLFILCGLRFTAWPEMFSYPYLRNNGFLIYKDMIHPYPPLLTMALSVVYKVFGYSLVTLRSFTYVLVVLNDILIFLISKKILKKGLISFTPLFFYVLTQPFLDGNMLWFDFAMTTPILFSLFFLFEVLENKNVKRDLFLSGLFLSVAVYIKQTSVIFFLISIIFLLSRKIKVKEILYMFIAPLIISLSFLIRLIQENALMDFLNWNLFYPSKYWTKFPGYVRMNVTRSDLLTLLILAIPILAIFFKKTKSFKNNRLILCFVFLICSFITVYPRFSFFHFQPALAIFPIFMTFLVEDNIKIFFTCFILFLAIFLYRNIYPKIISDWGKEARFSGFEEKMLTQVIQENSNEGDKVFFIGLNSNLYVSSQRIPPKRWFDNYGWYLEIGGVEEEILSRWNQNPPKVIFWKLPLQGEWYELGVYQPDEITRYIFDNYNRVSEPYPGVYLWNLKDR